MIRRRDALAWPLLTPLIGCLLAICAARLPGTEVSVISQNVWFDDASGKTGRYENLLDELASAKTDVITLQEVTSTAYGLVLEKAKVHQWHVAGKIDEGYGNVTLSTWPLEGIETLNLPTRMGRKALICTVVKDERRVRIINIHLDSMLDDSERRKIQLKAIFATQSDGEYLVIGDFNFGDDGDENSCLKGLNDPGAVSKTPTFDVDANPIAAKTKFDGEPSRRIDKMISPTLQFAEYAVKKTAYSDHFAITAVLK